MAVNKVTDQVVTKWVIDPGRTQKELKELNKQVTKQVKKEQELYKVKSNLNKIIELQNKKFGALSKTMGTSVMKANLYGAAAGFAKDKIKDLIKNTGDYNRTLNAFTGDLELARNATQGLVSDMDLMLASNRLNTLGVKLSNEEYADLLSGVTKLSDAMGISMKEALDSTATALSRQSVMVADNIGVTIKVGQANEKYAKSIGKTVNELTASETKLAFQREFLEQVAEKAGELPPKMDSFTNALTKTGTSLTNSFSKWAAHIDRSLGMKLDQLVDKLTTLRTGIYGKRGITELAKEDLDKQAEDVLAAAEVGLAGRAGAMAMGGGEGETSLFGLPMVIGRGIHKEGPEFGKQSAFMKRFYEKRASDAKAAREKMNSEATREWNEQFAAMETARAEHAKRMNDIAKKEFEEQEKLFRLMYQNEMKRQQDVRDSANAIMEMRQKQAEQLKQEQKAAQATTLTGKMEARTKGIVDKTQVDILNQGIGAFSSLGSAMFQAAEMAEQSGMSFEKAMGKIVKSTLKGIAITSAVKALEALALAAFHAATLNPFLAGEALKSAGLYTATAIAAGAASAAIGGGGAVGAGSGARSRVRNDIYEDPQRQRPQFAKKEAAAAPINIDLYIGDPNNPSSALVAREQLNAQLSMRKQSEFSEI